MCITAIPPLYDDSFNTEDIRSVIWIFTGTLWSAHISHSDTNLLKGEHLVQAFISNMRYAALVIHLLERM